jgi:hypothetical protein
LQHQLGSLVVLIEGGVGAKFQDAPRIPGGPHGREHDPEAERIRREAAEREWERIRRNQAEHERRMEEQRRLREDFLRRNAEAIRRLQETRRKCIEAARARHAEREAKIMREQDDCLESVVKYAGGAAAGGLFLGPKGAFAAGASTYAAGMIVCMVQASKDRMRSLLEMQSEIDECVEEYAAAYSELE